MGHRRQVIKDVEAINQFIRKKQPPRPSGTLPKEGNPNVDKFDNYISLIFRRLYGD
jgi:hypothetical protein